MSSINYRKTVANYLTTVFFTKQNPFLYSWKKYGKAWQT